MNLNNEKKKKYYRLNDYVIGEEYFSTEVGQPPRDLNKILYEHIFSYHIISTVVYHEISESRKIDSKDLGNETDIIGVYEGKEVQFHNLLLVNQYNLQSTRVSLKSKIDKNDNLYYLIICLNGNSHKTISAVYKPDYTTAVNDIQNMKKTSNDIRKNLIKGIEDIIKSTGFEIKTDFMSKKLKRPIMVNTRDLNVLKKLEVLEELSEKEFKLRLIEKKFK